MEKLTKNDGDNKNKKEGYRKESGGEGVESSSYYDTGMSVSSNVGNDSIQEQQSYEGNENVTSRETSSNFSILSLLPSFLQNSSNREQEEQNTVQTLSSRRHHVATSSRLSQEEQKNSPNNSISRLMIKN